MFASIACHKMAIPVNVTETTLCHIYFVYLKLIVNITANVFRFSMFNQYSRVLSESDTMPCFRRIEHNAKSNIQQKCAYLTLLVYIYVSYVRMYLFT